MRVFTRSKDKPPPGRGLNRALSGIRAAFAPLAIIGLVGFTPILFFRGEEQMSIHLLPLLVSMAMSERFLNGVRELR